jgi:hypothetical protein
MIPTIFWGAGMTARWRRPSCRNKLYTCRKSAWEPSYITPLGTTKPAFQGNASLISPRLVIPSLSFHPQFERKQGFREEHYTTYSSNFTRRNGQPSLPRLSHLVLNLVPLFHLVLRRSPLYSQLVLLRPSLRPCKEQSSSSFLEDVKKQKATSQSNEMMDNARSVCKNSSPNNSHCQASMLCIALFHPFSKHFLLFSRKRGSG